ncbi:MAG: CoA pyrophosphatase [Saprospiraceae bacterium]|nr:MAG: NUDIX hydrolase [Bacteroidetes bacterium OLB9]MCO6462769.1 CoA pyrophosphatase [Saprospiraceae bacterium]MCZ2339698.1 CoA pyrophosphatase [Chitinophagales bacterium]
MDISFIHELEHKLDEDLPGERIQNLMAPPGGEKYRELSLDHMTACVMLLLFPKDNEWHFALIERTSRNPLDKHSGQISLPGGKMTDHDYSFEDCALRETYEEIGVSPDSIGILGHLTPLYVYVSNFLVHPFIGFTTEYPRFTLQKSEVEDIIELPLEHILKSRNKGVTDMEVRDHLIHDVPYYDINGKKLWGATAMIVSEMEYIIRDLL